MPKVNDMAKSEDQWAISFSAPQRTTEVAFTINAYCEKYNCIPVSVSIAYNNRDSLSGSLDVAAIVKKR